MKVNHTYQLLSATTTIVGLVSSCTTQEKLKPNVLFIMSDDHDAKAISLYGSRYATLAPTPNIDRIGKEGMRMDNVFCTNAISGPSRASIITGKYSHQNGFYKNESGGHFDNSQLTFPKLFQKEGYQTAVIGKWHLGSEPTGFDYYKVHATKVYGGQGQYWNPVYDDNGTDIIEKGYSTNLTTDFALKWLKDEQKTGKPFLLLLQYKAPHRPWDPDSVYMHLFDSVEMPYPETFDDDYAGRELTAGDTWMTMQYLNRKDLKQKPPKGLKGRELVKWYDKGNKPNENWVPKDDPTLQGEELRKWKYQQYIKAYLATVRSVDDNVGRVLNYLDSTGLADNTIVIYTADQGFYLGDHGWFDKRFMYEQSLRMPFLIRYPLKVKGGVVNEDIITNIDFAPTLLTLAGIQVPKEMQGKSFAKNLEGKNPDWRQSMYYHYYEFPWWHHVHPHYGIRTDKYKLIHFYYDIDKWELYDLENDPEEMNNLINDPSKEELIISLKKQMKDLQKEYNDDKTMEEWVSISDSNFYNKK